MKNFFDILKNVCILAHEEIPESFGDIRRQYDEIKQYINGTLDEICSKFPWTFRERKFTFNTVAGQREYELPDGLLPVNILKDGIRIDNSGLPLYFVFHNDLDTLILTSGKPYRYSVYSSKLILDPTPDSQYTIHIKYLTINYALDSTGVQEKQSLESEDDIPILPERFIKVLEWGAYSLYRQNLKPDNKYKLARDKFLEYLFDMQKQDGYSQDSAPSIIIGNEQNANSRLLEDFFSKAK